MKKFFFAVAAFLLAGMATMAQTPNEMQYQLLVTNQQTGEIKASQKVEVRIEVRKDSPKGNAVWAQTYETESDKRGLCNLTLDFGDKVDWSNGSYYLATLIDGEEAGAPKLTSVPYALQAKKAAALDGVMTDAELVGTWKNLTGEEYEGKYTLVFNADHTGTQRGSGDYDNYDFKWQITNTGALLWEGNSLGPYSSPFCRLSTMYKIDATHMVLLEGGDDDALHYVKQ